MNLRNSVIDVSQLSREELEQLCRITEENGIKHISGENYDSFLDNVDDYINYISISGDDISIILLSWKNYLKMKNFLYPKDIFKTSKNNLIELI